MKADNFKALGRANSAVYKQTTQVAPAVLDANQRIYGQMQAEEYASGAAELISIYEIDPDPTQPRRAIPSVVREALAVAEYSAESYFHHLYPCWNRLSDRGEYDVWAILDNPAAPQPDDPNPVLAALLGVINLAASIQREGLTNPITVAENGKRFRLETGERRWLAYGLLDFYHLGERYKQIPARIVPAFDRWRQATENTQRNDLNLIGKARQYALLLMALYEEKGFEFAPYSYFGSDRAYYAQVLELGKAPDGASERLVNGLGVGKSMFTRFRHALELGDEQWREADENNWSEIALYSALNNSKKRGKKKGEKPSIAQQAEKAFLASEKRLLKVPRDERITLIEKLQARLNKLRDME